MRRSAMSSASFYRLIRRSFAAAGAPALLVAAAGSAEAQVACEAMRTFSAPDVRITAATPAATPVPLCKVDGVIGTRDPLLALAAGDVERQVRHGRAGWLRGSGGKPGAGDGRARARATPWPEPTPATSGRRRPTGRWALGNLERIVNFGHAAIHRVTATAKAAVTGPLRPRRGEGRTSPAARTAAARP